MTHSALQIIHGSPFALRFDGSGSDPVDGSFAEAWTTVMRFIGDQFEPMRRFTESPSRRAILGRRYRLDGPSVWPASAPPVPFVCPTWDGLARAAIKEAPSFYDGAKFVPYMYNTTREVCREQT